jgi:hypothetical protein
MQTKVDQLHNIADELQALSRRLTALNLCDANRDGKLHVLGMMDNALRHLDEMQLREFDHEQRRNLDRRKA